MSDACAAPAVVVIGIGNDFRHDDAAGLVAARLLRSQAPRSWMVIEHGGEGAGLIELWKDAKHVMVIDAVRSGDEPGTVHELEAAEKALPRRIFRDSTHAFSLGEAVELARVLGALPKRLTIYGIEGQDFSVGEGLTPAAKRAVQEVVQTITSITTGA